MYMNAPGPQPLPGTQLIQRLNGLSSYVGTPSYWGTPAGAAGIRGLGCACGGHCQNCSGMGLFDSGLDVTGWGWPEFAISAGVAWLLYSTLFTVRRGARAAREGARKRVKGIRRGVARRIEGRK